MTYPAGTSMSAVRIDRAGGGGVVSPPPEEARALKQPGAAASAASPRRSVGFRRERGGRLVARVFKRSPVGRCERVTAAGGRVPGPCCQGVAGLRARFGCFGR